MDGVKCKSSIKELFEKWVESFCVNCCKSRNWKPSFIVLVLKRLLSSLMVVVNSCTSVIDKSFCRQGEGNGMPEIIIDLE